MGANRLKSSGATRRRKPPKSKGVRRSRTLLEEGVHLGLALLIGSTLAPVLGLVPGQPSLASVLTALFAIALPALTYMLLAGMWLLMLLAGGNPLARNR